MDKFLAEKIECFLSKETPTDKEIRDAALLLLQCAPARSRSIYNSAMVRPRGMLAWIRADLRKYYAIHAKGLASPEEVRRFNDGTVAAVEESLATRPEDAEEEVPQVPVLGIRGKREDHDLLPEEVQALWVRNAERWKKMRQLHAQLAQLMARPDYAPCDGNELCYLLRKADTDLRNDYETYDSFVITPNAPEGQKAAPEDRVDEFTDNVKAIQNARAVISRGLSRKTDHTEESLRNVQDAVNTLFELRQAVSPKTIEKLKALNIAIPGTEHAEG